MEQNTEAKIVWIFAIIGLIVGILICVFLRTPTMIGDCGTNVQLNENLSLFLKIILKGFTLALTLLAGSLIGGLAVYITNKVINTKRWVVRKVQNIGKPKPVNQYQYKKDYIKSFKYFIVDSLTSFSSNWVMFNIFGFTIYGLVVANIHDKICYVKPDRSDVFLVTGLFIFITNTIAAEFFTLFCNRYEIKIKKMLKL